ncbi:MAG: TolC family protein [Candidatus Omnitrophica bacterium]|nr:TolC family protein [Candidatus Omnitrophota bacterium]
MKYVRAVIIILFLSVVLLDSVSAEETLLWQDCVKEAKGNHPDLLAALEKIKQVKASKEITRSAYLPQLNFDASEVTTKNASFGASGSSVELVSASSSSGSSKSNRSTTYQFEVSAQQLLFDGFKTSFDLSSNERSITASKYNYDVTSSNIRLRLRTAYANLLSVQEYVKVAQEIEDRRKKTLELVKLRYEGGREHKGSLMTSEADLTQAIYDVAQATRNVYLYQRQLTKELGRLKFDPMTVEGDLDVKDQVRMLPNFENITDTNPLLRQLIAQKEAAQFGLKSAYANFFPQIYANGSAGNTGTRWFPDKNEYSIGTSITFPIFDGGNRIATARKANGALGQSQAEERSGRDSVVFTLANTWTQLQNAVDNVGVQKKVLTAAQERAKIASAEYSIGLLLYDNWIIIENNLVLAKKAYIVAQNASLVAEANWVQAKGGTLDDMEGVDYFSSCSGNYGARDKNAAQTAQGDPQGDKSGRRKHPVRHKYYRDRPAG